MKKCIHFTNKVILQSLFKFTHKQIYIVNILRYLDIIKNIFKKNISYSTSCVHAQFNLSLGFTTELSYKHFKIQLSVQSNSNQYLSILQCLSIYIGNLPNSQSACTEQSCFCV